LSIFISTKKDFLEGFQGQKYAFKNRVV